MADGAEVTSDGLKRDAGFLGLLFTSEGSIIGSGWLFGALFVSTIGGPAAVVAWLIGSVAVILLALVHAELGGLFPVTGGTARFPHYAFGNLAGASFGWFSWLQAAGTAPIEVEAALQYSSNYVHGLTHTVNGTVVLTGWGYLAAVVLMGAFTVLNLFGIRRLIQANNAITTWKVLIPTMTIVVLFSTHFDTSNFTSHGFAPYGTRGVLEAVSLGGAVFSLVGFEQAVQLGGESRNPQRDIPRAVIGSMVIGATIYLLLQIVFIGALPHSALAHGWHDLSFQGIFGPFAGLAKGLGLAWLAYILYADAIIAPIGTGLVYTTTTSRLTYGMSKNGQVPAVFEKTDGEIAGAGLRPDLRLHHGPDPVPPLPRVAEPRRVHHLGHRPDVRRRATGARGVAAPEAGPAPVVPAARRLVLGAGGVHRRQLDHLLEWVGGRLEAVRGRHPRLRPDGHLAASRTPTRSTRRWTGRPPCGCGPTWPAWRSSRTSASSAAVGT